MIHCFPQGKAKRGILHEVGRLGIGRRSLPHSAAPSVRMPLHWRQRECRNRKRKERCMSQPLTDTALDLLDPRALAAVSRMELVAKTVMDGYVQGMHKSPHIGFALDFAQHRQYAPGDDIKRIDWRVYAKADRYYIKQYEVSTNLRCHIVLDASGSMSYRGTGDALSKFRYAQFVAGCLSYLVLNCIG